MGSGVSRVVVGTVIGTGSVLDVRTVGFRPSAVRLMNVSDLVTSEWTKGMADDSMVKRITAGTMTFPTSGGVTPLSDGFKLGADADLNVSGEIIHWVAQE